MNRVIGKNLTLNERWDNWLALLALKQTKKAYKNSSIYFERAMYSSAEENYVKLLEDYVKTKESA